MTPTARSLKHLRDQGYRAQVVERWNGYAKVRVDLFGIIDIVALRDGENGVLGIQSTTQANLSNRLKKIRELKDNALIWLRTGNRFTVHAWANKGPRGKRKTWQIQEVEINERNITDESRRAF